MDEELIILGNGFDLNAGLKSGYQDFLNTDEAKNSNNLWIEIITKGNKWQRHSTNWSDIENVIEEILVTHYEELANYLIYQVLEKEIQEEQLYIKDNAYKIDVDDDKSELDYLDKYEIEHLISSLGQSQNKVDLYKQIQRGLETSYEIVRFMIPDMRIGDLYSEHNFNDDISKLIVDYKKKMIYPILQKITSEIAALPNDNIPDDFRSELIASIDFDFNSLLLKELNNFEMLFTDYLKRLVANNIEYLNKSNKTFNSILRAKKPTKVNVLSFNYTNPFENDIVFDGDDKIVNNVHGTLDQKNIIFGIDLTKRFKKKKKDVPKRLIPYTKTFRKMSVNTPDNWILPKNPIHIRVYGHSLNSSDYSYFQSIFDYIDLYDSNVILEFCFSVFGAHEKDKYTDEQRKNLEEVARASLKYSQQINAYSLINEYGSTLNNKDQGNNLLHKLLLENRLKVREIPKHN